MERVCGAGGPASLHTPKPCCLFFFLMRKMMVSAPPFHSPFAASPYRAARPSAAAAMSRKENALELGKLVDKTVRVKLSGGREGERREGKGWRDRLQSPAPLARRRRRTPPRPPSLTHTHTTPNHTVEGVLKAYDQLLNLVLDEATEYLRGACAESRGEVEGRARTPFPSLSLSLSLSTSSSSPAHATPTTPDTHTDKDDPMRITDATRALGLCVCRGTAVMAVAPSAGACELADNPFAAAAETGGE